MFLYYYALLDRPIEEIRASFLEILGGAEEAAEVAYRRGEEMRARLRLDGTAFAKTVRMDVGTPVVDEQGVIVPLTWKATGTPGLFPRMEAELTLSSLGPSTTHLSLQGRYRPPLGALGRALDKLVLHRVAEVSVKTFVDLLAERVGERAVWRVSSPHPSPGG